MTGLEDIVANLSVAQDAIPGALWIDGSFMTRKVDPRDADMVLSVRSGFINTASTTQKQKLDWFAANLKQSHLCDTYVFVEYDDPADPEYWVGDFMQAYWKRQFGFGRQNQFKGIAVITLPIV